MCWEGKGEKERAEIASLRLWTVREARRRESNTKWVVDAYWAGKGSNWEQPATDWGWLTLHEKIRGIQAPLPLS